MNKKKFILAVLAFIVVTFAIQALSYFVINAKHYASIDFLRPQGDQIFSLGILTMVLQGMILAYFYPFFNKTGNSITNGLKYSLLIGTFLISYIALVEPAKYLVPSIFSWIAVESIVGLIQFSIYGLLLGVIYRR